MELVTVLAIKEVQPVALRSTSEHEFSRFLREVVSVYATQRVPGSNLAHFDEYNEKPLWSLFVPFDVTTFDASAVLHKPLVAEVVILLEKMKRNWPKDKQAKVIFKWRLKKVPKTARVMGSDISGFMPTFVRESIELLESSRDELVFCVFPCDAWPDGATVLRISGDAIYIDDDSPPFCLFKPKQA